MQKAILVYNPVSGLGKIAQYLDEAVYVLQKKDILVIPLRTPIRDVMFYSLLKEGIDYVLVSGGDGTIHQVVNLLASYPTSVPLGVIPTGTSNDFAMNLGLPDFEEVLPAMKFTEAFPVDLGCIGDRYFINVASGGLLIDVAHKVDQRLKNNLGKIAYYLQGLTELPGIKPFTAKIIMDGKTVFNGELLLFLILNGHSAGSFKYLAPSAALNDGLLDLLIFKRCSLADFLALVVKVLAGKHINDPNILYLQGRTFDILSETEVPTDLDGERGTMLPWHVDVVSHRLRLIECSPDRNKI